MVKNPSARLNLENTDPGSLLHRLLPPGVKKSPNGSAKQSAIYGFAVSVLTWAHLFIGPTQGSGTGRDGH